MALDICHHICAPAFPFTAPVCDKTGDHFEAFTHTSSNSFTVTIDDDQKPPYTSTDILKNSPQQPPQLPSGTTITIKANPSTIGQKFNPMNLAFKLDSNEEVKVTVIYRDENGAKVGEKVVSVPQWSTSFLFSTFLFYFL